MIHLWVEGFFEVFATVVIAYLCSELLIPNGFYQLSESINHGTWFARSAEVIGSPWMRWTVWLRIPGDIVFAIGAATMFLFTARAIIAVFRFPIPTTKPELTATAHASGTES